MHAVADRQTMQSQKENQIGGLPKVLLSQTMTNDLH